MRRLIAAACIAAVAFGAAACKPGVRAVVVFVGDSNMVGAATEVGSVLNTRDNGYVEFLLATTGSMIRTPDCAAVLPPNTTCASYNFWKLRLAAALPRIAPDAIVVELGINDAARFGGLDGPGYSFYDTKIDWFMALLPPDLPVAWTNLPCLIEPSSYAAGCEAVNAALAVAPTRHPNLTILDWASTADPHPDYMVPNDVHYSQRGANAYARFVAEHLDASFPEPPDDPTTSTSTATTSSSLPAP